MKEAQEEIAQAGQGLIVYLRQEGRGNGVAAHIVTQRLRKSGLAQSDVYRAAGFLDDNRSYNVAGKVIKWFRIRSIRPLSKDKTQIKALQSLGIVIEGDA